MSTDLKQDILQAVRKGNCSGYKSNSHACRWCPCAVFENDSYICKNTTLDTNKKGVYKIKPRKVKRTAFCKHCGKKCKVYLDWMGCAWPTDKGVVTYRELEARCPHCLHEIYIPALNDVNVYRRNKAYAEKVPEQIAIPIASGEVAKVIERMMQMSLSEETERGKEMFERREQNG